MTIVWMPINRNGLTWKLFEGSSYKGHVRRVEPRHYVAVTTHGSMLSALTMREAADWLEKVSCLVPKSN